MPSLKQQMINGVFWSAVAKYANYVVSLVVNMILARLISPEEFGVIAIANVAITFLAMFSDMGFGAAIVQRKDLQKQDYDSIFSFSIYLGAILAGVLCISSFFIADFYNDNKLVLICQVLSIPLAFSTFNMVPSGLLSRDKRFKFSAKRSLFFNFIGCIISVLAAFSGLGCYALIISPVVTSVGVFFVNYQQYPLSFKIKFDISPIKKVFSYTSYIMLFGIFNYFTRNLDKLIIGKFFSLRDLGYYDKSYNLMMMPLGYITGVITPVMHPIFSELQGDFALMAKNYARIIKLLATISFPLGIFLYFASDNLIFILYGETWLPAVPVFEILTLTVPFQMIITTTGAIYQASNRTDWLFYSGLCHTSITVAGFLIAAFCFNSIEDMAWSFVITMDGYTMITLFIIYSIILKQSYFIAIKPMLMPLVNGLILFFTLYLLDQLALNHAVCLLLQILITFIITVLMIQMMHEYDMIAAYHQVMAKLKNRR